MIYTVDISTGAEAYQSQLVTGSGHSLLADEPESLGGTNKGSSPDELLAAALGSCAAITLRMYANRKQWPLTGIRLSVDFERNEDFPQGQFRMKLHLEGDLSPKQKERLTLIAGKCPVHKTLSQSSRIDLITI